MDELNDHSNVSSKTLRYGKSCQTNILNPYDGMTLLEKYILPLHDNAPTVVIVSIDFEYATYIHGMGISTFDTRSLFTSRIPSIQSKHYRPRRRSEKFLFGLSKGLSDRKIRRITEEHICPRDGEGAKRDVIIVGHGVNSDLILMGGIGIDLSNSKNYPSVIGIIDTQDMAKIFFQPAVLRQHGTLTGTWNLKSVLERLHIPYRNLHNAGNDSHFTLRALLMLCVLECGKQIPGTYARTTLLAALQSMVHEPVYVGRTPGEIQWLERRTAKNAKKHKWTEAHPQPDYCDWLDEGGLGDLSLEDVDDEG